VTDLIVTTDPVMSPNSHWAAVQKIVVPPDPMVCGNDIALIILSQNIDLPQYVTPAVEAAITDHSVYSYLETAIGYGIDAPGDNGSGGTRRIKQNIDVQCIPNDPNRFRDCTKDSSWQTYMTANEFVAGNGTCEGDSGSSAYEQNAFSGGNWLSLGVLSRGGTQGSLCVQAIYTRLDAWASLIISTAIDAASLGGYTASSWTTATPPSLADAGTSTDSGNAGDEGPAPADPGAPCSDTQPCNPPAECSSLDGTNFVCTDKCGANASCATGFKCIGGDCFPEPAGTNSAQQGTTQTAGCSVGAARTDPTTPVPWRAGALAMVALGALVHRRRRG
jgi:MYXO-CTERM domain-containing protein